MPLSRPSGKMVSRTPMTHLLWRKEIMKSWLFGAPCRKLRKCKSQPALSARPWLEALEDRVVPALINHGGAILPSVQAQAVYLGSGWTAAPYTSQTSQFDAFLSSTVNGTMNNFFCR